MTKEELFDIIASNESFRIELTTSTGNMDKFQEAICAFANDMPGSHKKGYLLIGVKDNGELNGLKVDDALMKKISGIRSDGNILPLPVMSTEKVVTGEGDVLVVEVTPPSTPLSAIVDAHLSASVHDVTLPVRKKNASLPNVALPVSPLLTHGHVEKLRLRTLIPIQLLETICLKPSMPKCWRMTKGHSKSN